MINQNKNKYILPAIYMGIFAALCWITGDFLIVGFTLEPDKYPLLSETYASQIQDIDLATLMLSGSTARLMWGALIAVFSVPFYLLSAFVVLQIIKPKFRIPVFALIFIGFAYAPLGHASFFYVGEIYKTILNTDVSAHPQLLQTANGFMKVLKINLSASVIITGFGWLLFGITVATGKTSLKRNSFWINPITFIILIMLIVQLLPSPIKDWIAGAGFNGAMFIFYISLLILIKNKTNKPQKLSIENYNI